MASRIRRHTAAPTDATFSAANRSSWQGHQRQPCPAMCWSRRGLGGRPGSPLTWCGRALRRRTTVTVICARSRAEASFIEALTRIEGVEVVELPIATGYRHCRCRGFRLAPAASLTPHSGLSTSCRGHSSKAGAFGQYEPELALRSTRKGLHSALLRAKPRIQARRPLHFHVEKLLARLSDAIVHSRLQCSRTRSCSQSNLGIAGHKLSPLDHQQRHWTQCRRPSAPPSPHAHGI